MLRGKFVPLTIQTSVKFCNCAELYLRSLKTYHFQIYFTLFTFKLLILRGTLFCGVDRFSLTGPYKKLKKPWTGLLCKPETHKELKRVLSYVCFVQCSWLFKSTIFGTRRRDTWPIKLRKQRDILLLQVPALAWKKMADKLGKNSQKPRKLSKVETRNLTKTLSRILLPYHPGQT